MDTHDSSREEGMNDIERRLATWAPRSTDLDADAMLFAAGIAAGRRGHGRFMNLAAFGLLAALSGGFAVWGLAERAERLALTAQLREHPRDLDAPVQTAFVVVATPAYEPAPDDYLSMRRLLDQEAEPANPVRPLPGPPPPEPSVPTAGQRDSLRLQ